MADRTKRIVLVSFADRRYRNALRRLEAYTDPFPFTERHFCDETNTFDKKYWRRLKPWLYRRGYGYWKWKADLIKAYMEELDEGDVLVYSDAGIVWNATPESLKRFDGYVGRLSKEVPVLAFQEPYIEEEWSKGDLLNAAGVYDNSAVLRSKQLWGGVILLMKSDISSSFLSRWTSLNELEKELITDHRSSIPNKKGFKEHRHDQSSFSVLVKQIPHVEISYRETQVANGFDPAAWDALAGFPIHARRTKEVGRPLSEIIRNKLLRPWRMLLNLYFRRVRDYEFAENGYPW